MKVPDKITNEMITEASISQQQKNPQKLSQNNSLISKADEFFLKKVPLVDVMNSLKELKESQQIINKLELKVAILDDKLTDITILLNSKQQQNQDIEALMKVFQDQNEKKLKDIIKLHEERLKDQLNKKVDFEVLEDNLNMKASKTDYGDLYKKYSQLYIGLEPLIINQDVLKNVCKRIQEADQSPDIQQQIYDINRQILRFETSLENRNKMLQKFKAMKKEMRILNKQVALLYDEHIYSIDKDDSEDEIEKKKRKTQKLQDIKQKITVIESPKLVQKTENSDSEIEDNHHPKGMIPPSDEDLRDNPKLYHNLHGFSESYLQKQKVLEEYTPEKLFRYLQSQVNDVCDFLKKRFEKLKGMDSIKQELRELEQDHLLVKEIQEGQVKAQNNINQVIQQQIESINHQINDDLLNSKKIEQKFKDVNLRIENIIKSFDDNKQKAIRINEERLRRIVNLESEVHLLKTTTDYLKSQKRQLNQYIRKEVDPIKEAKYLFDMGRMQLNNNLSRLEQKLDVNCNIISNELEHIKEPIKFQINDIKQEKEIILRELEKVYKCNRDLVQMNTTLKDQVDLSFTNSNSQLHKQNCLNQTILSWNTNSREKLQTRQSESRSKFYNNNTNHNQTFNVKINKSFEDNQLEQSEVMSPEIHNNKSKMLYDNNSLSKCIRPGTSISNSEQKTALRRIRKNVSRNKSKQMSQTLQKHYQTQNYKTDRNNAFEVIQNQKQMNNQENSRYMKIDQNQEDDSNLKRDQTQFSNFVHSDLNNVQVQDSPQTNSIKVKTIKRGYSGNKNSHGDGGADLKHLSYNDNKSNFHVVIPIMTESIENSRDKLNNKQDQYNHSQFFSQSNNSKGSQGLKLNKFKHIFDNMN